MTVTLAQLDDLSRVRCQLTAYGLEPNGTVLVERQAAGGPVETVRGASALPFHNPDGLALDGQSGNYASTPDGAPLDITGDIDLRADATLDLWATGADQTLIAKWTNASDQRSYRLMVDATGAVQLNWSTDGSGTVTRLSTQVVPVGVADRLAVRATLDVDNGNSEHDVTFYTAPSLAGPWTQLGTVVTTAGTTSIFVSAAVLEVGSTNVGTAERAAGTVHAAEVYDGIDGTPVASPVFAAEAADTINFNDDQGNTWTVQGDAEIVEGVWAEVDDYEFYDEDVNTYTATRVTPAPGLHLGATAGDYASAPDAAALDVTGDIDLRADLTLDDWAPPADSAVVAKWNTSGDQRSYTLLIDAGGKMRLRWSDDGAAVLSYASTAPVVPPGPDGRLAIRATLDIDDGSGNVVPSLYTAPSIDAPWTLLETQPVVGTTSIHAGTAALEAGSSDVGAAELLNGSVRAIEVRTGINGTLAADPDFAAQASFDGSFDDDAGNTWTINGNATIFGEDLGSASITPSLRGHCWLKSIIYPLLNRRIRIVDYSPIGRDGRGALNEIQARSVPVNQSELAGSRGFSITFTTETAADERDIDLVLAAGQTMFLHIPAGSQVPGGYVRIGRSDDARTLQSARSERRLFAVDCRNAAQPVATVVPATLTWGTVRDLYGSWPAVRAANPAWREVWHKIGSPEDLVTL